MRLIAVVACGVAVLARRVIGLQLRPRSVSGPRRSVFVHSFTADFSPYKNDFPHISPAQWAMLEALALKLVDWNAKVNLISRKDIDSILENHIVPCLGVSQVRRFRRGERVIDVGSGGGLPGLPTAIICPDAHFTLLDSNTKKMMVVQDIATSLGLQNVRVVCDRAEKVQERFDFMLGRSVSAVPTFLGFSAHLMDAASAAPAVAHVPTGVDVGPGLLYIKGGDFSDELNEAGVRAHHLFPIRELVPSVPTNEKYVLYIPGEQIIAFRKRQEAEVAAAAKKASKR